VHSKDTQILGHAGELKSDHEPNDAVPTAATSMAFAARAHQGQELVRVRQQLPQFTHSSSENSDEPQLPARMSGSCAEAS
jgi:hypothetical protein